MPAHLIQLHSQACHNCRRQRLKCDRSLPQCFKCLQRSQECLGYERLFRWGQGVASRGKMAGVTFEAMAKQVSSRSPQTGPHTSLLSRKPLYRATVPSPKESLIDPLVQDMDPMSRKYLSYFSSRLCKDLVLCDSAKQNPFRQLIPLTHRHPILLHIIIANSALHMANANQKHLPGDTTTHHVSNLSLSSCASSSAIQTTESANAYRDALVAKQWALWMLRSALTRNSWSDIDVILAVVLLFIEFELLDTGHNDWRCHINGARAIIATLNLANMSTQNDLSPLRSCLISNYLVFDILGSTLSSSSVRPAVNATIQTRNLSLLQDAEGNHCSSFPAILLQLLQTGARLYPSSTHTSSALAESSNRLENQQQALHLLSAAQSFDPIIWAAELQQRSPTTHLPHRIHVASAHRAAVCIYLSRVSLSLDLTTQLSFDFKSLVADIISHLSFIHQSDAMFTATTWPAFIAGAETNDVGSQTWVKRRFQVLWKVEPWGLIRNGLGVLENIWAEKRSMDGKRDCDWLRSLRAKGVDWLII